MKNDILIIGAGAAGLMAARTLANAGKIVTVLEARNRLGGRIHTITNPFTQLTELGAEFIHGNLPVTLQLLKEANIKHRPANAQMWQHKNGRFEINSQMIQDWELLISKLNKLKEDINIYDFLQKDFPEAKYEELKRAVWNLVSGYDTANPHNAGAFALRTEWQHEQENAQHRLQGGYCSMINYLADSVKTNGGQIVLNAIVKKIEWHTGHIKAITEDDALYEAQQILIALPLGVLQANEKERACITFYPPILTYHKAIRQMGFGTVIKLLLEFSEAFWLDEQTKRLAGKSPEKMGYLFSEEVIPTWWTQAPDASNTLTGWIGGPAAAEKKNTPDEVLLAEGLQSLANIFKRDIRELKANLLTSCILNWTADPFTLGSYAYDTVEAPKARKLISTPVKNTIYFTGEYLYEGTAMGTVEAAITNGADAASKMIKLTKQYNL